MNKEILKEQEGFYEFIKSYEYILENGRMDLEAFCVNLSTCFACDNILYLSPQPRDMYDLLIQLLSDHAESGDMGLWVQTQNIIEWRPEHSHMYPEGYRTCIHVAGLIHVMHRWVYDIGHTLVNIPESDSTGPYFDWVRPDWLFVHTFINGFHDFFFNFLKELDRQAAPKSGCSSFEALHKAKKSGIDFDQAVNLIKIRASAQNRAMERIDKAIASGFYLEAIALSECVISNYLYNFLESNGERLSNPNFKKLIDLSKNKNGGDWRLLEKIDGWRSERNKATHGFVESTIEEMVKSQGDFIEFSKEAAETGRDLCVSAFDWYANCAVNFIETRFEPSAENYSPIKN